VTSRLGMEAPKDAVGDHTGSMGLEMIAPAEPVSHHRLCATATRETPLYRMAAVLLCAVLYTTATLCPLFSGVHATIYLSIYLMCLPHAPQHCRCERVPPCRRSSSNAPCMLYWRRRLRRRRRRRQRRATFTMVRIGR
jgi:hypothetical protein